MKKIIISLAIIGIVSAIGIGATISYFNDTETSSGNIFTAGSLDLKVDHKFASYDGNSCEMNCVVDKSQNLIQNGDFEVPEVTNSAKWQIFPSGTPGLAWTVEWVGSTTEYNGLPRPDPALVEYHENIMGPAAHGDQYTELDSDWYGPSSNQSGEPALVRIYQDIPTVPGKSYDLYYYFSPRPRTNGNENILYVKENGHLIHTVGPVAGGSTTQWTEYHDQFIADSDTTRIEFIGGGTDNSLGVFLDDVRLYPINCEYQIVGGNCSLWNLKNIGDGDYFWNFNDIKPGDYGVNIISLHSFDNDAYACLITNDIQDEENTRIDPEIEAGDTTDNQGELSQFIKIFIWEDSNQNNVYDLGENILLPVNSPITDRALVSLTESHTKYIGLAWCAGTQSMSEDGNIICDGSSMGDIAQTDVMTASLTVYAEQQRNNSEFSCENVNLGD